MLDILYEDNHIIVVYKPQGILSQADGSNKLDMLSIIKDYLVKKYNKPGEAYLGLVHRLDLNTSGVMVFAKTSKAAKRLCDDIKDNKLNKCYLAVVKTSQKLKQLSSLENYLDKDEELNKSFIVADDVGKLARLDYVILEEYKEYSLVDINLITGRHHQIRVQFSNISSALYGDVKYGGNKNSDFHLALQAYKLEFMHPVKKEKLEFIKYNKNFIFKVFKYLENK